MHSIVFQFSRNLNFTNLCKAFVGLYCLTCNRCHLFNNLSFNLAAVTLCWMCTKLGTHKQVNLHWSDWLLAFRIVRYNLDFDCLTKCICGLIQLRCKTHRLYCSQIEKSCGHVIFNIERYWRIDDWQANVSYDYGHRTSELRNFKFLTSPVLALNWYKLRS